MRKIQKAQMGFCDIPIAEIKVDAKCRDDVPTILLGLQHIYGNETLRQQLFALLDEHILPGIDKTTGRPGMDLWRVLVIGLLKQGLNCDFDRLQELVNQHRTIRQFLGHADGWDEHYYELQTIIDNIALFTPELLQEINRLIVECGHKLAGKRKRGREKKKPANSVALRGRCDSFVVDTDVHYPTDVNLLWDAMRVLIRETGCGAHKVRLGGWRQWKCQSNSVKRLFNRVRETRRARPEHVKAYLDRCQELVDRVKATLPRLVGRNLTERKIKKIEEFLDHAVRQIDQVERRLLKGEKIPHDEKVFSVFEKHTRWISKGKKKSPVEFGVPVCIVEDQHGFVLHHKVMWEGGDTHHAVPVVKEAKAQFPELRAVSFDRGFHSPANRIRLDELLDHNVLPKKGRLSRAEQQREQDPRFAAMRCQHPAVESAINNLEHRGLDRVRTHGAEGFDRTVSLSVVAFNVHRLGLLIRRENDSRRRCKILSRNRVRLRPAA